MKPKHVEIRHLNGNPLDSRLFHVGLTCKGTWSKRAVHADEDGDWYVLLNGVKWYLDDPATSWIWVD